MAGTSGLHCLLLVFTAAFPFAFLLALSLEFALSGGAAMLRVAGPLGAACSMRAREPEETPSSPVSDAAEAQGGALDRE